VSGQDAIVYDLDGTLVRLDVDWEAAAHDAAAVLRARGLDVSDLSLWDMLQRATAEGYRRQVNEAIAEHEREGARRAERLPLAEDLPRSVPVGVCSLNAEAACRIALELHGLDGQVDAIVGRDTLEVHKPDPAPLLWTLAAMDAAPESALFVGDSERDASAARRAGVDFQWASDRRA